MPIYPAIYDGPPRHYGSTKTAKRYIAIHNTSNDASAEAEASYAKRREDSVSSHYYCDNNSLIQSLDTDLRAFHAGSAEGNSRAVCYEITGTNAKTRTWWLDNVAWLLLARQIAVDCKHWGIVPRALTVDQIRAGQLTGVITHDQMRQAWGGTTHTDPGPNFPMEHLLALVAAEMEAGMTVPQVDLSYDPRTRPKPVGTRSAATLLADVWGQELLGGSPVDGNKSYRTAQLDGIEQAVKTLVDRPETAADVAAFKAALMSDEVALFLKDLIRSVLQEPEVLAAQGEASIGAMRAELND